MNMNKILTASLLASVITFANASDCTKTGFYVGVDAGAQYNNNKIKAQYNKGSMYFKDDGTSVDGTGDEKELKENGNFDSEKMGQITSQFKKNKTKPTFALVIGYNHDIEGSCTVIGGELYAAMTPGKTKKEFTAVATNKSTKFGTEVKEKFEIGAFLKAGYKVAPDCTIFVKLGCAGTQYDARITGYKLTPEGEHEVPGTDGGKTPVAAAYTIGEATTLKKSKIKFGFAYGFEVEYKLNPDLALTAGVVAKTRTSVKLADGVDAFTTYKKETHSNMEAEDFSQGIKSYKTLPIKFTLGLRYFF